jgi:hypothetical protein
MNRSRIGIGEQKIMLTMFVGNPHFNPNIIEAIITKIDPVAYDREAIFFHSTPRQSLGKSFVNSCPIPTNKNRKAKKSIGVDTKNRRSIKDAILGKIIGSRSLYKNKYSQQNSKVETIIIGKIKPIIINVLHINANLSDGKLWALSSD